jgi:hypothetical protein
VTETLYIQVTAITEEYLGPAAERFLARQISFHLGKLPTELENADIPMLIEWTRVTLGMLTEDREMIEEYAVKMAKLVHA